MLFLAGRSKTPAFARVCFIVATRRQRWLFKAPASWGLSWRETREELPASSFLTPDVIPA